MISSSIRVPFLDLKAQYRSIDNELWPSIQQVIENTQFILGPAVERFETAFAQYCRAESCVATGSGTDSLHLALAAAGVGPGDEVITQANTFVATLEAIAYTGARIVLVDVAPPTYTIDVDAVRRAVTKKTKAIIPVHLFGQPCEIDAIYDIASEFNLLVIEDASQAHGGEFRGKRIGERGVASFSFYPGKNLGAFGEGGAVTANDSRLSDSMRVLRNHGSHEKYVHSCVGYNYRMDGIQGAVLEVKLRHLEEWTEARRRVAARYDVLLTEINKPRVPDYVRHVYHLYPVFVESRDEVRAELTKHGVETNIHYPIPCHTQEAFKDLGYRAGDFPFSEYVASHELSLPMYAELPQEAVDYVAMQLKESI